MAKYNMGARFNTLSKYNLKQKGEFTMAVTQLSNIINPQVMADMISAELTNALILTRLYKVNRELKGRAGDTITIPTYDYIGEATDLAENAEGTAVALTAKEQNYTVKKVAKFITLTDEAMLSGYGNPKDEAIKQLRMSIQDKIDNDGVKLLEAINGTSVGKGMVYDGSSSPLSYDSVVEALDLLNLEEEGANLYLIVSRDGIKQLRKDPKFIDKNDGEMLGSGVVGMVAGCKVKISKKVTNGRAYVMGEEALTAFIKRDVNVETQREVMFKRTIVSADEHYTVAIEDYSKIAVIKHKAEVRA